MNDESPIFWIARTMGRLLLLVGGIFLASYLAAAVFIAFAHGEELAAKIKFSGEPDDSRGGRIGNDRPLAGTSCTRPAVIFFCRAPAGMHCPPCKRFEADRPKMPEFEFREAVPPAEIPSEVVPLLWFTGADGRTYYVEGWDGPERFRAAWQRRSPPPAASSPAPRNISDLFRSFAGESGTIDVTPAAPVRAVLDDGTTVTYRALHGTYSLRNQKPVVTFASPLPLVTVAKWGLRFGAEVRSIELDGQTVGIDTSRGKYRIELQEAAR